MKFSESQLKEVLATVFRVDATTIDESTSVDTVESWDSMSHLNLVLALEQKFDVTFTSEQTIEILNYPLIKIVLAEHGVEFQ